MPREKRPPSIAEVSDWRLFSVRLRQAPYVWHQAWALSGEDAIQEVAERLGVQASLLIAPSSQVEFQKEPGSAWDLARKVLKAACVACALLVALPASAAQQRWLSPEALAATSPAIPGPPAACTTGWVRSTRKEKDGDIHVRLCSSRVVDAQNADRQCILGEIAPTVPVFRPKKGQRVEMCGLWRWDSKHKWPELHPLTGVRLEGDR